jgi:hypothetical protein
VEGNREGRLLLEQSRLIPELIAAKTRIKINFTDTEDPDNPSGFFRAKTPQLDSLIIGQTYNQDLTCRWQALEGGGGGGGGGGRAARFPESDPG